MAIYDYGQLFTYSSNGEVVIPDTQEVKSHVTNMMKYTFGDNFDTSESSPNGRIIETLTVMYTNILGVIAQNANGLNPNLATGNWLDTIGAIFVSLPTTWAGKSNGNPAHEITTSAPASTAAFTCSL
jgi:hypothetical protein